MPRHLRARHRSNDVTFGSSARCIVSAADEDVVVHDGLVRRLRSEISSPSDEQYRLLVDAVIDYAIYMLDPQGRVSSWNSGARRLKGYEAEEIIGQHFSRFYTEKDRFSGCRSVVCASGARGRFETKAGACARMARASGRAW